MTDHRKAGTTRPRATSARASLDPRLAAAALLEAGPVTRKWTAFAGEVWVVTGHRDVGRLGKDPRLRVSAPTRGAFRVVDAFPDSIATMDPPHHTRVRRVLARELGRRLETSRTWMDELCAELVDGLPNGRTVDVMDELAPMLPVRAITRLLGVPGTPDPAAVAEIAGLVHRIVAMPTGEAGQRDRRAAQDALSAHADQLIDDAGSADPDGLLCALVRHRTEGALTAGELTSTIATLFAAGVETTASAVGSGLLLLLRDRARVAALVEHPPLVATAVEELLRVDSPINLGVFRFTSAEVEVGDVVIPAGAVVLLALSCANQDPSVFADPHAVDLARTDNPHLAFGVGPHYCVGAGLARQELRALFAVLLDRYPRLRLAIAPEDVPWSGSTFRGPTALPLLLAPP